MSAFVAVAKAGGFSAAARALGIPLATISRRVADLERALGARLLHRSTRQVVLTETGQGFFATCQRVLDELKDAEEAVGGEYRTPKGELTVTAPVGFGRLNLQPVVIEFLAAYPEINVKLLLLDRRVQLVEEQVDLALRVAELPDSSLIARPLGHVKLVVTGSPRYLARRDPPHPADLMHHDCIAWTTLGPLNTWWFRDGAANQTFPVHTRLTTTNADSAIAAAQGGLGLVQTTSYQAEQGLREKELVLLLRPFECPPTPVNLVYASQRLLPLKLRAFIDFAVPRLTERLRAIAATLEGTQMPPSRSLKRKRNTHATSRPKFR